MQNLNEGLKKKVYGLMYEDDIKDIVFLLSSRFDLTDYIESVTFSYEESSRLSLEDAVDYNYLDKEILINMPILHSKFSQICDKETYPYNWMILFQEIIYALEDIQINKLLKDDEKSEEAKVIKTYREFIKNGSVIKSYPKLYKFMANKTTNANGLITPVERIKLTHAYFKTIDVFKNLHINQSSVDSFKQMFDCNLLNGYSYKDQNIYPLRCIFFQNSYIEGLEFMSRFDWYSRSDMNSLSNASIKVSSLKERLALGYPIDSAEYTLVRRKKI